MTSDVLLRDVTDDDLPILFDGQVAGNIVSFLHLGKREVGYWLGKEYWGKGIATKALSAFLAYIQVRPRYAGAAKDKIASLCVLEKCGFTISGEGKRCSSARGEEVEEFILILRTSERDERDDAQ